MGNANANTIPELDKVLAELRRTVQKRGLRQQDVQKRLGWGRTYLSQLFSGHKRLRLDQLLAVLDVVGVEPKEFWFRVYGLEAWRMAALEDEVAELSRRVRALERNLRPVPANDELEELPAAAYRPRQQG